jgi:hypothetical protein
VLRTLLLMLPQETDVDCGGGVCGKCMPEQSCRVPSDCQDGLGGLGSCPKFQDKYRCGYPRCFDGEADARARLLCQHVWLACHAVCTGSASAV